MLPPFQTEKTIEKPLLSAFPYSDDTPKSHPASPLTAALAKIGANLRPDRPPFCFQLSNWTYLRQPLSSHPSATPFAAGPSKISSKA